MNNKTITCLKCSNEQKKITFDNAELFIQHCKTEHAMVVSESPYEEKKCVIIEKSSNVRKTLSKRSITKKK